MLRRAEITGGRGNPFSAIGANAFRTTNCRSRSAMRGVEFHSNTRRDGQPAYPVYRPPSGSSSQFMGRLENTPLLFALEHNLIKIDITLIRDFNIDFRKTQDLSLKSLSKATSDYRLRQLIKRPTRVTNRSKSIIDLKLHKYSVSSC